MDYGRYAVWLLRTGYQDGDDTPDKVTDVHAGNDNTVLVKYRDMGHRGATILRFAETPDGWKSTVPSGLKVHRYSIYRPGRSEHMKIVDRSQRIRS